MAWFAVRTFYRWKPVGRPRNRDRGYIPNQAVVEERVVLFEARDARTALRNGRREATAYARSSVSENVYGQRVRAEVLGHFESYAIDTEPGDGAEIFSSMELTSGAEAPARILRRRVGRPTTLESSRMFMAGWITERLDAEVGRGWTTRDSS